MRQFFVCSLLEVMQFSLKNEITHILTLLEEKHLHKVKTPWGVEQKIISFADEADPQLKDAPQKIHLEKALSWISETLSDAKILIHCFGGVSRSPAMCLAAMFQEFGDMDTVEKEFRKMNRTACPNELICLFADQHFNLKNEFQNLGEKLSSERILLNE